MLGGAWALAGPTGGDNGQPDSTRALALGPDAVLRALGGGVALGPPTTEADGEAADATDIKLNMGGERSGADPLRSDLPEHPEAVPAQGSIDVWVTFYTCPPYCGAMANGERVYDGAAACGYGFALGQRFSIENDPTLRIYVCADRGAGPEYWVDIFWADAAAGWEWQQAVGSDGAVRLLP